MKTQNIHIQHALSPNGEYFIPGIGKVDGYCHENNFVYEYHGNYWHGNPNMFPQDEIHPVCKPLTYGDLYRKNYGKRSEN